MAARPSSEFPPSGCYWCDRGQREHGRQWVGEPAGWHVWTPPTNRQIKERMFTRRMLREETTP